MRAHKRHVRLAHWGLALGMTLVTANGAWAQTNSTPASTPAPAPTSTPAATPAATPQAGSTSMTVYGFAMLDIGHNFGSINPNWQDTMRVSRLPSFDKEFGEDGQAFAGVRQSRLGVKTTTGTSMGDLNTTFEFELFGVGVDEGQTTFRLRHAYGELGKVGAGQTWSLFMDPDVFPNSLEYWGPTGMVFFRNVQVRFIPLQDDKQSLMLALERPGASGDQGIYSDRIELDGIVGRNPMLDITGAYKYNIARGYVRAAGVVRRISWDDTFNDPFDLSGDETGWGLNFSSNIKLNGDKTTLRLQYAYGEGIQNYMNDAPVDIGIVTQPGNITAPITGKALPIQGIVVFADHNWNDKWASSFGFSTTDIDNSEGQSPDAYKAGRYALGNLLYMPVPNVMMGGELQWGRRENFSDGWTYDGVKVQFSFKYSFSHKIGG